ncbi:hypothetical protein [Nocardia sp. X0981]
MSTEKPVSDPLEPEGTGVPADAAAEHTASGTDDKSAAASSGKTEPIAAAAAGPADEESTASAEGESAESAGAPESADDDATVKVGKAAAEQSAPAGDTDTAAEAADDPTVRIGKSGAEGSGKDADAGEKGDGETVRLGKSGAEDSGKDAEAGEKGDGETVRLGKSASADAAGAEESGKDVGPKRKSSLFPLPVSIGAAVLLIVALAAVGVFFFLAGDRQEELDRRAAATKAACDFGNSFATYTGAEADEYLQRLDRSATGEWKKLVAEIGPDLKTRFAETQVSSTATEVQCGYESGSGDNARVVLVIDQQFTTADTPQQQGPGQVKVAANVDMQKVDGTWLVANFDTPMMQQ